MPDMLFILLLALVLLGPKKLPQVAAQIGKYLAQFQRMRRDLLDQVTAEVARLETTQAEKATASEQTTLMATVSGAEIMKGNPVQEIGSD